MNNKKDAEKVIDIFGMETIKEVDAAIRASMGGHPPESTCECMAMEALGVLVRNGEIPVSRSWSTNVLNAAVVYEAVMTRYEAAVQAEVAWSLTMELMRARRNLLDAIRSRGGVGTLKVGGTT